MDIVNSLIAANADPNCICKVSCMCLCVLTLSTDVTQNQCTPLHAASKMGFTNIVKSLLAANADPNYVTKVSR